MKLRIAEHAERSDTGLVRSGNEDAFLARPPLFVVADGMGGASAGEVASRAAVETFAQGLPSGADEASRLVEVVRRANSRIHSEAERDSSRQGMGTTVTAALVGGDAVTLAHVGDSRAYLIRSGAIAQLTSDHTLVGELVREGRLTEEEALTHPQRSIITRALGPESAVEVDSFSHPLEDGDVLLLCSDGLTGMVSDRDLLAAVDGSRSLGAAAKTLVRLANEAGGRDNITVVLVRVSASSSPISQAMPVSSRTAVGGAAAKPSVKRRRTPIVILACTIVVALLVAAGWRAAQGVFFVGSDSSGVVTIYRGLPYELPFGLDLYSQWYASGAPMSSVPSAQRSRILDHRLRTKRDASDLVAGIERGTVGK